jgi:hypothetical protein
MTCHEFMQASTIHHCKILDLCRRMTGKSKPYIMSNHHLLIGIPGKVDPEYISTEGPKNVISTILLRGHAFIPYRTDPDPGQQSGKKPWWTEQL